MTLVIDASVLVAIAIKEPEALYFIDTIGRDADRLCCTIGLWEAARAIARKRTLSSAQAGDAIDRICLDLGLKITPLGEREMHVAMEAHDRYGKGTGHPARLNMGDCFAYACAKTNGARLLYKGDDFSKTDLA